MNVECYVYSIYIYIYMFFFPQQQSLPITVRDVLVESITIAGWLLFPIILIILIITAFLLLET